MSDISLGEELKCIITGFTGIATARVEYINGEIEYAITPQRSDKGYPKAEWISSTRLEKTGPGVTITKVRHELGFGTERPGDKK